MAVARIEPVYVRRYNPETLRGAPVERRTRIPRQALAVGVILAGSVLQHVMAAMPAEPRPAPLVLAMAGLPSAAASSAMPAAGAAGSTVWVSALHVVVPAPGVPVAHIRVLPAIAANRRGKSTLTRCVTAAAGRLIVLRSTLLPPVGRAGDRQRTAMSSNPEGLIRHEPSVSVAAIRAALRDAGSPMLSAGFADHKDAAEYIWDAGRVLGIDPAVLMAIFRYESMFGTRGVARLTDSVGNIRPLAGQPTLGGYRLYRSWQDGIDDCYRLLRQYVHFGADTVPLAVPVWAPASDNNDPGAYVTAVLDIMSTLYAASKA